MTARRAARWPALVALFVLGGCGLQRTDPCAGVGGSCLAVHLKGPFTIDEASLDVNTGSFDARAGADTRDSRPVALPVAVAVLLPSLTAGTDYTVRIAAAGLRGGDEIAHGAASVQLTGGRHASVDVQLTAGGGDDLSTPSDAAMSGDLSTAFDGARGPGADGSSAGDLAGDAAAAPGPMDLAQLPDLLPPPCIPACAAPTPICNAGTCSSPTSCPGLPENCGVSQADKCCEPLAIPAGSFKRSYDNVTFTDSGNPATISAFALDRMEVTVARFRKAVVLGALTQASPPPEAAGAMTGLSGSGWSASFDTNLAADKATLVGALDCNPTFQMWTATAGSNESRPMNCVTWYEAFAFCIWDGGRLPTEAEWNYAAAGGDDQRVYPWSIPSSSTTIDGTYASYYVDGTKQCYGDGVNGCTAADVLTPGSKGSVSKWGNSDLAGNVGEWVLDYSAPTYQVPCVDCAQLSAATQRVVRGGGFSSTAAAVTASVRSSSDPLQRSADVGFRCVYGR